VPAIELQNHLYGDDFSRDANALEVLITRLRKKLGPDSVGTRRGFGYYIGGQEP
jgi:DNA-binding response OmpR family regulator